MLKLNYKYKSLVITFLIQVLVTVSAYANSTQQSLHAHTLKASDGKDISLNKYKGKNLLIVNIATRCGYTGQLDDLEALHTKYKEKNFVVLGVPSNDFGGQTPEKNSDIVKFCKLNYGVSFPIMAKVHVRGDEKIKLYQDLVKLSNEGEVRWNFEKFLIDKDGKLVKRFRSSDSPLGGDLEAQVKKLIQ